MKDLIDFFSEKIGKNVEIFEYNDEELKEGEEVIYFNNNKYKIIISKKNINIKGYTYLMYTKSSNFDEIKEILKNLFSNPKIEKLKEFIVISFRTEKEITKELAQIIEIEIYSKTKILYLGYIEEYNQLEEGLKVGEELLIENSLKEEKIYYTLRDYFYLKTINQLGKEEILKYIFFDGNIESLDDETIKVGVSFIENNLNISKTASKFFIHRNTLIYKLEKIKEKTDMDIRNFNDAKDFYFGAKLYLKSKKV
ncbi:PucR family transcriptional regulator [Tepidibacter formicigenes]|jgi:DNA-binding PucR family transcriptional regulator|uniref:PucR C-terminal helix-turn-helix domain-containing protein n=1 Tax=Tepidibacter formicigenes DSM 15518 TaxID=1123349 RepID=A0A1M6K4A4_9FIRM|nr:helix-turn-helix domain-containing protein [Tepidibacter formicigenes]SHJ53710.1 PucR C-terminal helix-turn-helix domain-containing protein [Tepidibacter formicigenes DSM 15518]